LTTVNIACTAWRLAAELGVMPSYVILPFWRFCRLCRFDGGV
jgi:hypothetical protein